MLTLLFTNACTEERKPNQTLKIIYSGNLNGELEPCGCSEEGDFGGIQRRATLLIELRKSNPDLLLISSGGLIATNTPHDSITGDYIFKGLALLKYDAIGLQWKDLAFGETLVNQSTLPWTSSNFQFSNQAIKTSRHIKKRNLDIQFFTWLDPTTSPLKAMTDNKIKHSDVKNLEQQLQTAKNKHQLTVLTTTLTLKQAQSDLPMVWIDVLLIKANKETPGTPVLVTTGQQNTLILQPGSRGMRLGKATLVINPQNQIIQHRHETIPLPKTIQDSPALAQWYKAYNAELKVDYKKRVAIRKQLDTGESPFSGASACQTCHSKSHLIWEQSKHAHAFEKLLDVNKSFDANCVRCHSVGFGQTGGYLDDLLTYHLANVQCESCHGAGAKHVKSNGIDKADFNKPSPQTCLQCHNHDHSPGFDFATYWKQIKHE